MEPRLNTFVVSDMHLSEAHEPSDDRPLWMAYKRREFFIDEEFASFLDHIEHKADGPIELVLNGDIVQATGSGAGCGETWPEHGTRAGVCGACPW